MRWTVIRGSTLRPTPWRNGQGTSHSILTRLDRGGTLLWQVGLAELVRDAPFSLYPECDRIFVPIAGPPPELSFAGGPFEPRPLLEPVLFRGEEAVSVRVPGPARAFNVIANRRLHTAALQVLRLEAGDPVEAPDAPEVVVHCLEGELSTAGDLLQPGDSLLGPGPATPAAAASDVLAILVAIHPASATP